MAGLNPPRPLTASDDREGFDCGRASLNAWFLRHAWRNQLSGVSRTSVVCVAASGAIAGYVSLSSASIERGFLAKAEQRNRPDPLPAILIGQLAVDLRFQGEGIGRSLLVYALRTIVRLSEDVGCFCALTHPLDDTVRQFYRANGLGELPGDPTRSMAVRVVDLRASGF